MAKAINRTINILLLAVMFSTGCSLARISSSKIFQIKPLEELIEEKYKKLQNSRELTLETEISSQIFISRENPYYSVKYLKANLKILPIDDSRQKMLSLQIKPPGKLVGRSLEFAVEDPAPGFYYFKVKTETVCRHEFFRVTDKIPFPFQATTAEQIKYTEPSLIIDSNDENIHILASSIAEGEDDLYRVVFKASKWVIENVVSELGVSTVYTSQKASWVLENREGVCDEKTNLFIGLLRSLGIPAKFITGLVGVNYDHKIVFKTHSWAEIYFPPAGWIPFDVAYHQLGFIDATHIKLSESVDLSDSLTSYEWESVDISDQHSSYVRNPGHDLVSIKDLRIRTEIKQETGTVTPLLEVTAKVWHQYVNAESYNVIEATVFNPHKFYVITNISLQVPSELNIMGENNKMLLLEPDTKKTVYWIGKSTFAMRKDITATFPINIVASSSTPASVEFHVAKEKGYPKYSFEKLRNEVEKKLRNEL